MAEQITSAANPIAKRIRSLADRRVRRKERVFLVEGMQPVWRAVESGWEIDTLIVAPDMVRTEEAWATIDAQQSAGTRMAWLSNDLFARLSERDGPSGMMAIVRQNERPLSTLKVDETSAFVVLHRVSNPGNLGTIIRTADAARIAGVVIVGQSADPYAPAAVKASMGSIFNVPVSQVSNEETFFTWADDAGVTLVATSGQATADHWSADYPRPVGLVFGNEGDGLPESWLDRIDRAVRIPMTGTAESLNLAVAASLMMYEVQRGKV